MITLITGAPGSGKSALLVSLLLEMAKGRTVYADGIPDLVIEHQPLDALKWHDTVPDGSIIVIDEVQRVWRPRGPGSKIPESVTALETHRHRGLDFYIITQAPRLLDTNVRALVGRHVHLRELGVLGRWFYEWPECAENCAVSWKNAPIKKRYKLPKKIFGMYKSASEHIKPVRSFPLMLVVLVVALVGVAFFGWRTYSIIKSKGEVAAIPQLPGVSADSQGLGSSLQSSQPQSQAIDDRVDWIPRESSRPESAPAYDHLRTVVSMPVVHGGLCMVRNGEEVCKCLTQQGTDAGLSTADCRSVIDNPRFNPYRPDAQPERESQVVAVAGAAGAGADPSGAGTETGPAVTEI